MNRPKLVITAQGGIRFHASLDGAFLGAFEFGSIDSDGQYEQEDDEIVEAALETFQLEEEMVHAEVK